MVESLDVLSTFNVIFSMVTGWSLGYISVYYRRREYERYYGGFIYVYLLSISNDMNFDLIPIMVGLLSWLITAIFVYCPMIGDGYKIYQESDWQRISS